MWDRYLKIKNYNFGSKIKSTGCIYLPGSKYRESEGHLELRSCLQDAIINSAPRIGKYINKLELYNQCPPRGLKDTKMIKIKNTLCERSVVNVNPLFQIEIELWGDASILRTVNNGVFICSC